jgi:hypothetical protein
MSKLVKTAIEVDQEEKEIPILVKSKVLKKVVHLQILFSISSLLLPSHAKIDIS